uniref:Alpha-kinase 3a n=1 Tax=Nothobranchius furzeri TaxID=105023 RepID=A0A1A8ALK1_NOTFU
MNEYKIHQRFFEKLKQKAEKKKKDLEVKMDGKENIQKEQRRSPDHPQRKRSVPPTAVKADVNKSVAVEHPGDLAEPNAVSSGLTDEVDLTSENNSLESDASASEETLAKKRLKMSNGVDVGVNSSSERRSPLLSRRKTTLEVPKVGDEPPAGEPDGIKEEEKQSGKKIDPLKAPQVIRKIRGEPFPDASGHLKLWCQFFNVLSDSTIKCEDILSGILLKDDLEVGEEIEMTPLLFTKGLADSGTWGEKYFGRIFTEMLHIGEGCNHKTSRVKVIYGLDPIFESGSTCIIKIHNPIAYGTKLENNLAERNMSISKQECKIQNMIREYCKIFAAEARVNENFGFSLEVIPQYLIYRPANSVPYATVEADLTGVFVKYCSVDPKGKLTSQNTSELEQKCSTFQHWIHQWTHGNLLVTHLEGVETKIANVKVVTKSKGYQGLTESGSPEVFDQFLTYHQCNYYCGLLGLRPLKTADLQPPTKIKGSKSPLLNRRMSSSSPQAQRKGHSPQMSRKNNSSPKLAKKVQEPEDSNAGDKPKPVETLSVPEIR